MSAEKHDQAGGGRPGTEERRGSRAELEQGKRRREEESRQEWAPGGCVRRMESEGCDNTRSPAVVTGVLCTVQG